MEFKKFENFTTRKLGEEDLESIQQLCDLCSDYYMLDQGCPAGEDEARSILDALPPNKTQDDKYNFGLFDQNGDIIGLVDIIDGYPEAHTWMLGLMLIDPNRRRDGAGRYFHQEIIRFARVKNGKKIRIGVFDDNVVALKFWESQGYQFIKEIESDRGNNRIKRVLVFELEI